MEELEVTGRGRLVAETIDGDCLGIINHDSNLHHHIWNCASDFSEMFVIFLFCCLPE